MLEKLTEMNFAVYTKDGCPYCEKIKEVLKLTESKFVVYTLSKHFERKEFYEEFGEDLLFHKFYVMVRN